MSDQKSIPLELLSPAANADIAIEAILHGADAVYIGAPSHGARRAAANSIEDIRRVVDFAHVFRAKVYVTVNTIVFESELRDVERMIRELWQAGVDAIIIQDMGLMRMDLPPIALHASTQCDTRTVAKARFLEESGFSQIVLARELGLAEIKEISNAVSIPVEVFVHGALCVSYSGICHASQAFCNRSANRGECAQICRLPYDLVDNSGRILRHGKHLLSLKDMNRLEYFDRLIKAGARSFKIEGRLKEVGYVKNVTAAYSRRLDDIVAASGGKFVRSSFGNSDINFRAELSKSFNRGFTNYFLDSRRPKFISEPRTPKSIGEGIDDFGKLNNGDGISWFDSTGRYGGMIVNGVTASGVIGPNGRKLPKGVEVRRTFDRIFSSQLAKRTATRRIKATIIIEKEKVRAEDERGVSVTIAMPPGKDRALKPMDIEGIFRKTGNTDYIVTKVDNRLPEDIFIPPSELTAVRRTLFKTLDTANSASYPLELRRKENKDFPYPDKSLDFRGNVSNSLARAFYSDHGVSDIEPAMETTNPKDAPDAGVRVMTTRHCLLREMGMCRKEKRNRREAAGISEPLFLVSGKIRMRVGFDCVACEMKLFKA